MEKSKLVTRDPKIPRTADAVANQAMEVIKLQIRLERYTEGLKRCNSKLRRSGLQLLAAWAQHVEEAEAAMELVKKIEMKSPAYLEDEAGREELEAIIAQTDNLGC